MTHTPTDMETAMSETTPRPWSTDPEAGAPDIIYGADFTVLALANADNMAKRVADAELIVKAVNALSALGEPVVVAEALPELVEAIGGVNGLIETANDAVNAALETHVKEHVIDAFDTKVDEVSALLTKLKARP